MTGPHSTVLIGCYGAPLVGKDADEAVAAQGVGLSPLVKIQSTNSFMKVGPDSRKAVQQAQGPSVVPLCVRCPCKQGLRTLVTNLGPVSRKESLLAGIFLLGVSGW